MLLMRGRTDNDAFHYACAGKQVVRLDVWAFEKDVSLKDKRREGRRRWR